MIAYTETRNFDFVQLLINDRKRRGVAYVSVETQRGLFPVGTAFFVQIDWGENRWITYAVTARHCIDEQGEIFLEWTDSSGYKSRKTTNADWVCSETTDLACYMLIDGPLWNAIDAEWMFSGSEDWKPGLDVFIVGLFSEYAYDPQGPIEPIVRFGKLVHPGTVMATLCVAKSNNKCTKKLRARVRLIESISFGGESGAPVFLYKEHRRINTDPAEILYSHSDLPEDSRTDADVHTPLFGMISSHWLIESQVRGSRGKRVGSVGLNSGIAAVVPSEEIRDFILNDSRLQNRRNRLPTSVNKSPVPLSVDIETFSKEDFEGALKRVSKRIQPSQSGEEK
jgi:hypothetical protein